MIPVRIAIRLIHRRHGPASVGPFEWIAWPFAFDGDDKARPLRLKLAQHGIGSFAIYDNISLALKRVTNGIVHGSAVVKQALKNVGQKLREKLGFFERIGLRSGKKRSSQANFVAVRFRARRQYERGQVRTQDIRSKKRFCFRWHNRFPG